METKYKTHHILEVALLVIVLAVCLPANSSADEDSKYLKAVREFADNVLKYGRDTYGPKHTPLFVDGLNIHTHEPVKWIDPDGTKWILSNLASQQNLFRTLDGLTKITIDPKYRRAAVEAIEYAFENLRSPNGLLYWGQRAAYNAKTDKLYDSDNVHQLKSVYPYYELMWDVNPEVTKDLIESFWSAHILDWSNLDMDRISRLDGRLRVPKGWNQRYKGGAVFFKSKVPWGISVINTGSDLFQSAAFLSKQTCEKEPLIWAKRLARRYVETRHPKTCISNIVYNRGPWDGTNYQLLEDFSGHFVDPRTTRFPPLVFSKPLFPNPNISPWICYFLVGEMLGSEGKEFTQWAHEELTAWGKVSYRKRDNSFVPMLTDGTNLESYVFKKDGSLGAKGTVVMACPTTPVCFWAYSIAYRLTDDEFMWQMVRDIAGGNNLGEIGSRPGESPNLNTHLNSQDPYSLLGLLELYQKSGKSEFLEMACRIGDNILANRFHKGFFPLSKKHIYASFQALEPLALLHLDNSVRSTPRPIPRVWPSMSCFVMPYRGWGYVQDTRSIYTLTESTELPVSLQEAAFTGDVSKVRSLIAHGVEVNATEWGSRWTALQRAAMKGHEDVAELLLAKGAWVDPVDFLRATALHYAAENGHKEVAEMLVTNGDDIDARDNVGAAPLHRAASRGHKKVVELLIAKGADVNAKDNKGRNPLWWANRRGQKEIVELLRKHGAKE